MAGTSNVKVALITGGADGMGLAIAKALASAPKDAWKVHLVDIKQDAGTQAVATLGGAEHAVFHQADVTNYEQLAAAFQAAFLDGGRRRLDYVFANAGIFERSKYFDFPSCTNDDDDDDDEKDKDAAAPYPPEPDYIALDVNIKGAINTVHLARHYMVRSRSRSSDDAKKEGGGGGGGGAGGGSIVITASCSSFWPTYWAPIYTASKFGILGFLRAVAPQFRVADGIRINALCPGAMRTAIVPAAAWDPFPDEVFTPLEAIAAVALQLAKGEPFVDANGVEIPEGANGQAVIANGRNFYLQREPEYCDEAMRLTMESTKVDKH